MKSGNDRKEKIRYINISLKSPAFKLQRDSKHEDWYIAAFIITMHFTLVSKK